MELREYLFRKNYSITSLSNFLCVTRTHLSNVVHKKTRPSKKLSLKIEKFTEGEVSLCELRNDL